jgi:hypothetical protein
VTPAELDALTVRYLELASKREDIDGELEGIKAKLRDAYPDGIRTSTSSGVMVSVSVTRRFDPEQAKNVLPAHLLQQCLVTKVDAATAKKLVPPALYDACSVVTGKPTVRIA